MIIVINIITVGSVVVNVMINMVAIASISAIIFINTSYFGLEK